MSSQSPAARVNLIAWPWKAFGFCCALDAEMILMEFSRCKIVAIGIDDPRCAGLHSAVTIEVDDSRCRSLAEGLTLEVDDPRGRNVAIKMEDPRCQSLYMNW